MDNKYSIGVMRHVCSNNETLHRWKLVKKFKKQNISKEEYYRNPYQKIN